MDIKTENDVPAFARLAAQDASANYGPGYTWLYFAGPLAGVAASNNTPEYRWVTIDEIAALAERLGVYYRVERAGVPKRLSVYQGQNTFPGENTWYSNDTFAAYWETAYDYDFIEGVNDRTSFAISEWTIPINYQDEPSENWDYIQSIFPQGEGAVDFLNLPFGARSTQAIVLESAEHTPSVPSGWSAASKTKLLIQPQKHFRYKGSTDDRYAWLYIPIEVVQPPPINPSAVELRFAMNEQRIRKITHSDVKLIADGSSGDWGHKTMNYVTLVPRSAVFRT